MTMQSRIPDYPWYSNVPSTEPLQQGDFVLNCQIVQPTAEAQQTGQTLRADIAEYDVIVMSQSCDLALEKIELVLVCPFYSLTALGSIAPDFKSIAKKENLKKGQVVAMHLLDKISINGAEDHLVVDFKSVYAVPLKFLKQIIVSRGSRIRLLPPYREHLSQAFARFFMRVGLPEKMMPFK